MIRIDFSDFTALAAEFAAAPDKVRKDAVKIVRTGVRAGRDNARDLISGQIRGKYLPHYPKSITQEVSGLTGEFGPDASRLQGGMGPGVEFGSANHGPLPHMQPAADQLEQSVPEELVEAAVRALQ